MLPAQLKIRAYDTGVPYLAAEAEVFINVVRNLNRPVFNPARYLVTIREDIDVNTFIQRLNVSDPDGVSTLNLLDSFEWVNIFWKVQLTFSMYLFSWRILFWQTCLV